MPWGKERALTEEESIQCSLTKTPTIFIESIPKQKIQYLMDEYRSQEWLAYLRGRISSKTGNIFVEDISVPPHEIATGASAQAEPFHTPKDCVGIIHSHHGMGAFHSGTDQDYVDKNYPVSIVVARGKGTLTFNAVSYSKTPCGKSLTLSPPVKYVQPAPLFDKEGFLKEAKESIDKGKVVYVPPMREYIPGFPLTSPELPLIPIRYRLPDKDLGDIITDANGRVLTQQEVEDIQYNSGG